MNLDHRKSIIAEQIAHAPHSADPDSVVAAVMDIWQLERGHAIEDDEVYHGQQTFVAELLRKHEGETKDAGDLVDRILADMPGSFTYRDPVISGRLIN